MKFLVIAHGSFDVFHDEVSGEQRLPGGPLLGLAVMAQTSPNDSIIPMMTIGKSDIDEAVKFCGEFLNIVTDEFIVTKEPTHTVHYYQKAGGRQVQCTPSIGAPIQFRQIKSHLSQADGILISMNSGNDITLETLDEIRIENRNRPVSIHLDVHNLVLGPDDGKGRRYRNIPTWRRWLFQCTTVQLNEVEAAAITPDHMTEEHFVQHALSLGLNGLIITRDEGGVSVSHQEHKKIETRNIPANPNEKPVRSVGCGDFFAAAFLPCYVRTNNIFSAVEFASMVAGWCTQCRMPEDFLIVNKKLKELSLQ